MSGNPTPNLGGLARQLIQQGTLTEAAAAQSWQAAQKEQIPFISYLAQNKDHRLPIERLRLPRHTGA